MYNSVVRACGTCNPIRLSESRLFVYLWARSHEHIEIAHHFYALFQRFSELWRLSGFISLRRKHLTSTAKSTYIVYSWDELSDQI